MLLVKIMTLDEFSEKILRPSMLNMVGLPDTPEGNRIFDLLVESSFQNNNLSDYLNKERWRMYEFFC